MSICWIICKWYTLGKFIGVLVFGGWQNKSASLLGDGSCAKGDDSSKCDLDGGYWNETSAHIKSSDGIWFNGLIKGDEYHLKY